MSNPASPHGSVELVLSPDAALAAAGAAVAEAARAVGVGVERATRLRGVVEELLREARHREAADGEEELRVRCGTLGTRFVVEVHDRRLPISVDESRSLPSRRLVALGFAERLHVTNSGASGTVAEAELPIHATDADDFDGLVPYEADVARVDDDAAAQLAIRRMEPADAAGVSRCVYRCYGYSYLDPTMYRPRALRAALRGGHLHSVVAVEPTGEVVGHCALSFERPGDPVPEGGKLVVDPRYRGHHLAERLAELRADVAEELGVPGIWFECVTNHPFSQKEVLAGGGFETGLLIGAAPASVHMEALGNVDGGRHSLLAMWRPVGEVAPATLRPTAALGELLAGCVSRSGLPRAVQPGDAAEPPAEPRSSLRCSVATDSGVAHLRVAAIGADLARRVAAELDGLSAVAPAVVHLDLPLGDVACAWATLALEALGFAFAAWMPGFAGERGDVVRLQRVSDPHVPLDEIACARSEGEAVRDVVLREWRRVRAAAG